MFKSSLIHDVKTIKINPVIVEYIFVAFKGIAWNSLLIVFLGVNNFDARFISIVIFSLEIRI
ncbi:hypothetical protein SDC9_61609 [bioreactor metagenome]|uniref:Uncharacterized protein n=1 Tax=bioreactor metagenome TaxID=1076179 RepID=A0A644XHI7_9ZZZZ